MKEFRTVHYRAKSVKLPRGTRLSFAILCDLHGHDYGRGVLAEAIKREQVDMVLCGGDMMTRIDPDSFAPALEVLTSLAESLPVYLGLGNHEAMLEQGRLKGRKGHLMAKMYPVYEKAVREAGVVILRNETIRTQVQGIEMDISGLSLPLGCYRKPFPIRFRGEDMEALLGKGPAKEDPFHILLAHNPYYGKRYLDWGADLTVSGHYHGGILRLGQRMVLASPYFHPFPRYAVGDFHQEGRHLYVSPGLGEHTLSFRIHNPRELFILTMTGE